MTRKAIRYLANIALMAVAAGCLDYIWSEIGRIFLEEYFWRVRIGLWFVSFAIIAAAVFRFRVRWERGGFLLEN